MADSSALNLIIRRLKFGNISIVYFGFLKLMNDSAHLLAYSCEYCLYAPSSSVCLLILFLLFFFLFTYFLCCCWFLRHCRSTLQGQRNPNDRRMTNADEEDDDETELAAAAAASSSLVTAGNGVRDYDKNKSSSSSAQSFDYDNPKYLVRALVYLRLPNLFSLYDVRAPSV